MSKKKAGGKVRQHSQRHGKRLGLKISGGEKVSAGAVLIRQRGTLYKPGLGVGVGRDHTLFALREGVVNFKKWGARNFVQVKGNNGS